MKYLYKCTNCKNIDDEIGLQVIFPYPKNNTINIYKQCCSKCNNTTFEIFEDEHEEFPDDGLEDYSY